MNLLHFLMYEVTVTTKDAVMHSITIRSFDDSQGYVYLNNYRGDPDDGNTQMQSLPFHINILRVRTSG